MKCFWYLGNMKTSVAPRIFYKYDPRGKKETSDNLCYAGDEIV
jgi:hypothetical protein